MRRFAIICPGAIAALFVVAALAIVLLFHTRAGRDFIIAQAEPRIAKELGGEAKIGSLSGAPPGYLILEDVILSDQDSPWLTVERVELRWRPFALLSDKIHISSLDISGAVLTREPPERPDADSEEVEPLSISLPNHLPHIAIDAFRISDFRSALGRQTHHLNGAGSVDMGGDTIIGALHLREGGADAVDLAIHIAPDEGRFALDGTVAAPADGALVTMLDLNGPLMLNAKSDGEINAATILINAVIADYGNATASIDLNLAKLTSADVSLDFAPGRALSDTPEFAGPIAAGFHIEERRNGGAVIIKDLNAAPGSVIGEISWINRRRNVASLSADLSASLAPDFRPQEQALTGNKLTLTGMLELRRRDYGVDARLVGDAFALEVKNGITDLSKTLTGDVALLLPPAETAPAALRHGLNLTGRLDIDRDDAAHLRALTIKTGDGSKAAGDASYFFKDETIAADLDLSATPEFIASLTPVINASQAMTGDITLSGAVDSLTLNANMETPALRFNGEDAPALAVNAVLAGLPKLPTGSISAQAKNGDGRFNAQLRSSRDGRISAPALDYQGRGFSLKGAGAYAPEAQTIEINLAYSGEAGATPWPGLTLAGDFNLKGAASRDGRNTKLSAAANRLTANEITIDGLMVFAEGPPERIAVALTSNAIAAPQIGAVKTLAGGAVIDARGPVAVTLTKLEGVIANNDAHLTAPAAILFENGVEVSNFRLAYGRNGAIDFDGALSANRWRATAKLERVNIPNSNGQVSLDLLLDTDAAQPASGTFALQSSFAQQQTATLNGEFDWDGTALTLSNKKDSDALDMRLILPARLFQSPSLRVETNGPVDGYIRYDGNIGAVAPYLPLELQTLEGGLKADFALSGDTQAPELIGRAELTDADYTELRSGFSLVGLHIEADAQYAPDGSIVTFTGGGRGAEQSGEDTITLNGEVSLRETSRLTLSLSMNNAELSAHPVKSVRANGKVDIEGAFDALKAAGDITIEELDAEIITPEDTGLVDIDVVPYSGDAPEALAAPEAPKTNLDYAINIAADDRIFIRGRGLESEWSADIDAVNTRSGALITGVMNLRRGWLDFSGRRFDLTRGKITFDRLSPNNPLLDIRAEYETSNGVTAIIAASGRAQEPKVELISIPSLPSEDVMALVLFGKPAEDLSAVESLQTAQALAALGGVGPFGGEGVVGTLRQAVGLDLLNFDIDPENGGGELTVGKYVADGFFVSATQDTQGENGSVRVEYEITDNITVETEIKQDGDQTVSANWKRDF